MPKTRRNAIQGGALLGAGKIIEQGLGFIRNLVLANYLLPLDMGVAAALSLAVVFLTMISNVAIETLLVQSPDGDKPFFQKTAHLLEIARGVIGSLLLFAFADVIATGFGAPDADWAFATLAVVPLIRGFRHLDFVRLQREMRFGRFVAVNLVPQVLAIAAVWPLAKEFQNYSVALWLAIGQVVVTVVLSHALATRPYGVGWSKAAARQIWDFGTPLLINGCLLFVTMQGDNVIVGMWYGPAQLAKYALAAMIATTVSMLVNSVVGQVFLPIVSKSIDAPIRYEKMSELSTQCFVLIAVLIGTLGTLSAPLLVHFLFPEVYSAAAAPLSVLFLAHSFRILRFAPSLIATARGKTRLLLEQTLAKVMFLPVALGVAMMGWSLTAVAGCILVGEVVATCVGFWRACRSNIYPTSTWVAPFSAAGCSLVVGGAAALAMELSGKSDETRALLSLPIMFAAVAGVLACGPRLRYEIGVMYRFGMNRLSGPTI